MAVKLQPQNIPILPGVYFFKKGGKILYIGKAANLRARIRSYFLLSNRIAKLDALRKEATSLSWEILNSETEALIREAELIKKHRPKYNILMRDDKQYFYVGFTQETFPKIFITHQQNQQASYIGPFTNGGALRNVLRTLRRAFPYCTCKRPHKQPCLNARIERCLGFCCITFPPFHKSNPLNPPYSKGEITPTPRHIVGGLPLRKGEGLQLSSPFPLTKGEGVGVRGYQKNIRSIKQILSGKNRSLARQLKREMHRLSDARKYEEAGKIRDQIMALEKIFDHRGVLKQDLPTEFAKALRALESCLKIDSINRIEAYDVANIHGKFAYGSMAVFQNGRIEKKDYRLFKIRGVKNPNDPAMLKEVLERRLKHREWVYPEVIIVDGGKAQLGAALAARPPSKIIALTKNKKHVGDHVFIAGKSAPIDLSKLSPPLKNLILMLDSEAHRFAISNYRRLHRKSLTPHRKMALRS